MLRALLLSDAARISLLAGDFDVASMTGTIPHPYSEEMAAEWIASVLAGKAYVYIETGKNPGGEVRGQITRK